jgi:hypothetical protein
MPRPNYSNTVSVATNATGSELVLNFNHTYPILNEVGDTIKAETECVSSVVISCDMALKLRDILTEVTQPAEE